MPRVDDGDKGARRCNRRMIVGISEYSLGNQAPESSQAQ